MSDNNCTYVFIDESGDPGFKLSSGSTQLLCIAAVIFSDVKSIAITSEAITELRSEQGLKKGHEFHFNSEPRQIRRAFCNKVCSCPFRIRAIVVDKNRIYEDSIMRRSPKHFYNFITKMLLKHSFGTIENARVRIDGGMNRELKTYLRKELNQERKIIHDTRFSDSRTDSMIQLADMVTGSIARFHRPDKQYHDEYVRILRPCIDDIWDFCTK